MALRARTRVRWYYCKYCCARLGRDWLGQWCPTKNCQWHHGLPKSENTPAEKKKH